MDFDSFRNAVDPAEERSQFEQRANRLERYGVMCVLELKRLTHPRSWLNRIALHATLRTDINFRTFLEFDDLKTKAAGFSLLSMFKFDDSGKGVCRMIVCEPHHVDAHSNLRIPTKTTSNGVSLPPITRKRMELPIIELFHSSSFILLQCGSSS